MCKVKEDLDHKYNLLSKSFSASCSAIFLCFSLFLKGSIYVYKKSFQCEICESHTSEKIHSRLSHLARCSRSLLFQGSDDSVRP